MLVMSSPKNQVLFIKFHLTFPISATFGTISIHAGDDISIETCSNRNNAEQGPTVISFLSRRERLKRRCNYSRHSLLSLQDSANKRPQIIPMRKKTDESVSSNSIPFVCVVVFRNS